MNKLGINKLCVFLLAMVLFASCDISENEAKPDESFIKIYNNSNYSLVYDPLDVKATADSGYITLSAANSNEIYLMKADGEGAFQWQNHVTTTYVNPVSSLLEKNGQLYFFCMNGVNLQASLMKINPLDGTLEEVRSYGSIIYPLHASPTADGGFLLLSYNRDARNSRLTKLDGNFSQIWSKEYEIFEDVEEEIIAHINRTGERYPFFTGADENNNFYYMHGFYNYSLAMVFVNAQTGDVKGVSYGFQDKGGVKAAVQLQDQRFALARYSYNQNFIHPKQDMDLASITFNGEYGGTESAELEGDARVVVKKLSVNGKDVVLYGSNTRRNQLVLYAYDAVSGSLLGVKYLGLTNPYEIGGFTTTKDGGLAVFGRTFVAGRFPRLCLFKLTVEEINGLVY